MQALKTKKNTEVSLDLVNELFKGKQNMPQVSQLEEEKKPRVRRAPVNKAAVKPVIVGPMPEEVQKEVKAEIQKEAKVEVKTPIQEVAAMSATDLAVNFTKGSIDLYAKAATSTLSPVFFLINHATTILKGFAHLAVPLLMTYLLTTQLSMVVGFLAQAPKGLQMAYAVSFYLAASFAWISAWIGVRHMIASTKRGFYRIAFAGQKLAK